MRHDDDEWDVTTSVGATSLAIAICRALETERPDPLVRDPYAGAFVDAAGPVLALPDDPRTDGFWSTGTTYVGVCTRYFDESLAAAVGAGIRQVVLLADGLDVRAYRMGLPPDVTVYEVDQPGVLEFKDRVLAERGAVPQTARTTVAADLRHDWPAALRTAGFDPGRPTAWIAEGLQPYLPPDAERLLFERMRALSAPGSRIAYEDLGDLVATLNAHPALEDRFLTRTGLQIQHLVYERAGEQNEAARLATQGWSVATTRLGAYASELGRSLDDDEVIALLGEIDLRSAALPA